MNTREPAGDDRPEAGTGEPGADPDEAQPGPPGAAEAAPARAPEAQATGAQAAEGAAEGEAAAVAGAAEDDGESPPADAAPASRRSPARSRPAAQPAGTPVATGRSALAATGPDVSSPLRQGPILASDPGLRTPDLRLATLHLRGGMMSLARAELEAAAGRDDLDNPAILDLAEVRWRTGDLRGAASAATAWLDVRRRGSVVPRSEALAHVVLAESAAARGRDDDVAHHASAALEALAAAEPSSGPDSNGSAGQPATARVALALAELFAGAPPRAAVWPFEHGATDAPQAPPGDATASPSTFVFVPAMADTAPDGAAPGGPPATADPRVAVSVEAAGPGAGLEPGSRQEPAPPAPVAPDTGQGSFWAPEVDDRPLIGVRVEAEEPAVRFDLPGPPSPETAPAVGPADVAPGPEAAPRPEASAAESATPEVAAESSLAASPPAAPSPTMSAEVGGLLDGARGALAEDPDRAAMLLLLALRAGADPAVVLETVGEEAGARPALALVRAEALAAAGRAAQAADAYAAAGRLLGAEQPSSSSDARPDQAEP